MGLPRRRQKCRVAVDGKLAVLVEDQEHLLAVIVEVGANRTLGSKRSIMHEVQAGDRISVQ